jgi:hypothetical protein
VQRTEDGRTGRILGGRAIERSGGALCGLHRAHGDERGFLGSSSKLRLTVCEWFDLKTTRTVFTGLASKLVVMFFWRFDLKTNCDDFLQFGLKTGGDGFSRFDLKTDSRFLG